MLRPIQKAIVLSILAGVSAYSVKAASPTLTGADVGFPSIPGSVTTTQENGKTVYEVIGGGSDIWNASDNFYYAYFKVTGNFDYVVKVASHIGNSGDGGWSKAELMARLPDDSGVPQGGDPFLANMATRPSSDTANSAPAGVNNRGPQWRGQRDQACSWTTPSPAYPPNADSNWLRLERVGSVLYMYTSDDGKNWKMFNPYDPQGWDTAGSWPPGADNASVAFFNEAWPQDCLLGLAVTGHNDADVATVKFTDFGPYTPTPIKITTQPPASISVAQNNALTLSAAATGDPVHFQWLKDGKPIARAVSPTYSVSLAQLADAGKYQVKVFGGGTETLSTETVVTVTVDTVAPTVKTIIPDVSFTAIRVEFSEPVTDTALTVGNYKIDQGITVSAVTRLTPTTVQLTTSKMSLASPYVLTVNGIKDTASPANTIATDTKQNFKSLVFDTGMVTYERWDNANGDPGTLAQFITAIDDGTIRPADLNYSVAQFGGPWGLTDNYSSRVSGYFIPASSGDYVFFLSSDDASNLYLSTDENPANKKLIAQEDGWSNQYQWQTVGSGTVESKRSDYFSASEWTTPNTITLQAGKKYYIEILQDEGGGGDGSDATFIKAGDPDPTQDAAGMALKGSLIGTYLNPNGASINITEQPQSVTIGENTTASFKVVAIGTSVYGTNVTYQWQKAAKGSTTFADITGATTSSYLTPVLTQTDDGTQYRVLTEVPTLVVTSEVAVVTISSDRTPPTVVSAGSFGAMVGVAFDELVDKTSAETVGNYTVSGASVTAASLKAGKYVVLDLSGAASAGFTVTVKNIKDLAGNTLTSATVTGQASELKAQDVGEVGVDPLTPGYSVYFGNSSYLVAGLGHDIWDNADGFQFAYKEVTGAFDARMRVEWMNTGASTWAKTELMVRETTDAGSRHNSVCTTRVPAENAIEAQWRDTTDGGSGNLRVLTPVPYPNAWIRVVREDAAKNDIKVYTSTDGVNWTLGNTHTTPAPLLPSKVLVGIAVTSHQNTADEPLAEGLVHSFSVKPYTVNADPQLKIARDGSQVSITWAAGTLVSSSSINGAYTPVAGATSPYKVTPTTTTFYQVQQ